MIKLLELTETALKRNERFLLQITLNYGSSNFSKHFFVNRICGQSWENELKSFLFC